MKKLIATRIKGSDRWNILSDDGITILEESKSLTDALEIYFQFNGYRGEFIINPIESTIHILVKEKEGDTDIPRKKYSIYGDEE